MCGWVFLSGLIAATFIDLDHLMIPDEFTLGLGVVGVLLSCAVPALHAQYGGFFALDSFRSGAVALEGLLIGSGLVLWIALLAGAVLKKEAMGLGDVKFVRGAIGAFCGWHGAVFALFGGAIVGTLWLALALVGRQLFRRPAAGGEEPLAVGSRLPFGPMLAVAAALYCHPARAGRRVVRPVHPALLADEERGPVPGARVQDIQRRPKVLLVGRRHGRGLLRRQNRRRSAP